MAKTNSRTPSPEINPQRPELPHQVSQAPALLVGHLDTVADALTSVLWAMATKDFTTDSVDQRVFEVKTMVEALDREFSRLLDHVEFGEAGEVLKWPHIYDSAFHVQGLFYMALEGLDSMVLAGDRGYPQEGLSPEGVSRLLSRAQARYQELRELIASEAAKQASGAMVAH